MPSFKNVDPPSTGRYLKFKEKNPITVRMIPCEIEGPTWINQAGRCDPSDKGASKSYAWKVVDMDDNEEKVLTVSQRCLDCVPRGDDEPRDGEVWKCTRVGAGKEIEYRWERLHEGAEEAPGGKDPLLDGILKDIIEAPADGAVRAEAKRFCKDMGVEASPKGIGSLSDQALANLRDAINRVSGAMEEDMPF